MSSLPLIYSAASLHKRPSRQGGIFALSPANRVQMNKSEEMMNTCSKSFDSKSIKIHLYSLPKKNVTQTFRYSRQVFGDSSSFVQLGNSNSFVHPDSNTQYSKNPEEVDSVGSIKTRLHVSLHLLNTCLRDDS